MTKTVFSRNDQVAHVWGQQSQDKGRSPTPSGAGRFGFSSGASSADEPRVSFKGRVFYSYREPVARLVENSHGALCLGSPDLRRIWLAADHGLDAPALLELVDGLDRARAERINAAALAAVQAQLEAVRNLPAVYTDPRHGITLHRFRKRPDTFNGEGPAFAVSWPGGASPALEYGAALRALGESLVEAAEDAGTVDPEAYPAAVESAS